MPKRRTNQNWGRFSWIEAVADLRGLQDRISGYQGSFRDAGRADIADGLETAITLLIDAQSAAEKLSRETG
jgi:hypothetical protein